jgi:hypothetical protein
MQRNWGLIDMSEEKKWYVVKQANGHCTISSEKETMAQGNESEKWGPFDSESEAVARRVGLIRAGKCQPL